MKQVILSLTIIFLLTGFATANNMQITEYYGNDHFQLSEENGVLYAQIDKLPFESFTIQVENLQSCKENICSFKFKSSSPIYIKVDLSNGSEVIPTSSKTYFNINQSGTRINIDLDFTNFYDNLSTDDDLYLIFYIQPGLAFTGNVEISDFQYKSIEGVNTSTLKVYVNENKQRAIIQVPENENLQQLNVYDLSGRMIKSISDQFNQYSNYNLQLQEFNRGTYILVLQSNSKKYCAKVLIR